MKLSMGVAAAALFVLTGTACGQDVQITEESPGLFARAEVAGEAARATAEARVPGGVVQAAELEEEDGRLVFSFDMKVDGRDGVEEVLVDAMSGDVVSVEHETQAAEEAEGSAAEEQDEAGEVEEGDEAGEAEEAEAREMRGNSELSEESPGLLERATVTDAAARAAALRRVPGAVVVKAELEEEDGVLIYSYDLKITGKDGIEEVHVDAGTGRVLKVEHEGG